MDLIALAATPVLAYLIVVGMVALDATFPAIPSDAAVVSAGALAAAGHLSVGWSLAAVVVGAMAGDHLVYALARHKLPGILDRSRLGHRIRRKADRAYGRMEGVSTVALAMGRFIPFGRTAASATAGLVGVSALRYLWISLLGACTWAAWMVGLGFFTGRLTGGTLWFQVLLAVSVGFVVAAALAGVQRITRCRRSSRWRPADPVPDELGQRRDRVRFLGAGPLARFSAINSAARSSVSCSTDVPRGNVAFVSPSVM